MMQQIFIQTDSRVIDVSKIVSMNTAGQGEVIIRCVGRVVFTMPRAEADALLLAMANVRELRCIRAQTRGDWIAPEPAAAPAPSQRPSRRRKRKETDHV